MSESKSHSLTEELRDSENSSHKSQLNQNVYTSHDMIGQCAVNADKLHGLTDPIIIQEVSPYGHVKIIEPELIRNGIQSSIWLDSRFDKWHKCTITENMKLQQGLKDLKKRNINPLQIPVKDSEQNTLRKSSIKEDDKLVIPWTKVSGYDLIGQRVVRIAPNGVDYSYTNTASCVEDIQNGNIIIAGRFHNDRGYALDKSYNDDKWVIAPPDMNMTRKCISKSHSRHYSTIN